MVYGKRIVIKKNQVQVINEVSALFYQLSRVREIK